LIMGSVFYGTKFIHMTFDLKGSKQGRYATEEEKDSMSCVYKDADFTDQKTKIAIGSEKAQLLKKQLAADIEFLRVLKIMDYSLLLGIHRANLPIPESTKEQRLLESDTQSSLGRKKARARAKILAKKASIAPTPSTSPSSLSSSSSSLSSSSSSSSLSSPSVETKDSERSVLFRRATSASSPSENNRTSQPHRHTIGGTQPSGEAFRRQSTYGLPKRYNVFSSPIDIHFNAPDFLPVKELEERKNSDTKDEVQSEFTKADGGVQGMSKDGPVQEWYYLGIIDILTEWGTKKKMESTFKGLKYDKALISAVDPDLYAKRFLEFLGSAIT